MFACTDAPGVNHVTHEDAAVTNLTRMCRFQNHLHRRIHELVATDNRDGHAFNHIR